VRIDVTAVELGEIVVVQLKQPPDDGPVVLERLGHPYVHPLIISRTVVAGGLRQPGSLAHSRRVGDNAGMAGDDSGSRLLARVFVMSALDGVRPSGMLGWVSPVGPVVTQAAVGAGHWAAGRRRRALAAAADGARLR